MSENSSFTCPNCESENAHDSKYCNICGQKVLPLKVKIIEFISEFFDSVFNIDNRFYKTIKYIFVPAYLTKRFFEGKRISFYHPLRLYLVAIILLFTLMSIMQFTDVLSINAPEIGKNYEKRVLVNDQIAILNNTIDTFILVNKSDRNVDLIDSLKKELHLSRDGKKIFLENPLEFDTNTIKLFTTEVQLTGKQMFYDDIDSVVSDLEVKTWYEELILKQTMKGARDLKSLNKFLFANLSWLLLSLIPVFSFVLKLFYIRRKRYYLEHFVFLLHLFSALIFFGIVLLSMSMVEFLEIPMLVIASLVYIVFPFLAFKFYYGQSTIKTFIKYCGIGFFFLIAFVFCFSIFALITAALF